MVTVPVLNPQSNNPFHLIHSDLLVRLNVESPGRRKYMLTFIEYKRRYAEVNILDMKSDAPHLIQEFCNEVNTQTQRYSTCFRNDQGGEFDIGILEAYVKEKGITHQQTAACPHKSNGMPERYNQTQSAMIRPALDNAPS